MNNKKISDPTVQHEKNYKTSTNNQMIDLTVTNIIICLSHVWFNLRPSAPPACFTACVLGLCQRIQVSDTSPTQQHHAPDTPPWKPPSLSTDPSLSNRTKNSPPEAVFVNSSDIPFQGLCLGRETAHISPH